MITKKPAGKKVPNASQMSDAELLKWRRAQQELSNEAIDNIHTLASRTKVLYEDFLTDGTTQDEYLILAMLHGIRAIAAEARAE